MPHHQPKFAPNQSHTAKLAQKLAIASRPGLPVSGNQPPINLPTAALDNGQTLSAYQAITL